MNLGDLFQRLSYGELAKIALGADGIGVIPMEHHDRLRTYTNTVLVEIFGRMSHKVDYVNLRLAGDRQTYPLKRDHALIGGSSTPAADKFIEDTVENPFLGNIAKVIGFTRLDDPSTLAVNETEVLGHPRLKNAPSAEIEVDFLAHNVLRIPAPVENAVLRVEYQAHHVPMTYPADLTQEIVLAPTLEEALEMGVAARVFRSMGGEEHLARARELRGEFDRILTEASMQDLLHESAQADGGFDRVRSNGWV